MLKDDVLSMLKRSQESYLSGQRLSERLGVSRAAVWKAVDALRKDGFEIDSRPNCGYRLTRMPDVLSLEALSHAGTRQMGRRVLLFDTLDSTNNEIKRQSDRRPGAAGTFLCLSRREGAVPLPADAAPLLPGGSEYADGLVGGGAVRRGGAGLRRPPRHQMAQ